jgi:hypothetical protein
MPLPPEKRSQGPLVATIDLLFLVVCFFLLVIFFLNQRQTAAQEQLQAAQETLARVTGERAPDVPNALRALEPLLQTFMMQQRQEAERQRQLAARELRRAQRETVRVNYEILPGGRVSYEGRTLPLSDFKVLVIDPLRRDKWVALRAIADPMTPFGEVVASRRVLLENAGEFDTYWDNVTSRQTEAMDRPR